MPHCPYLLICVGLLPGLRPANERRRCFIRTSRTGWVQAYNQPRTCMCIREHKRWPLNKWVFFFQSITLFSNIVPRNCDIYVWNWSKTVVIWWAVLPLMALCLTHWGRVTHICVGNLTIIGPDDGLSPGRRQAIIWTNAGILLIGPWGTNFSEILFGIQTFSFKKIHLKMSSAKWRPFCVGLNELITKASTATVLSAHSCVFSCYGFNAKRPWYHCTDIIAWWYHSCCLFCMFS